MTQLELFEKPQYLHVWTEAERARAIKNPAHAARGESPQTRTEETAADRAVCQRIQAASTSSGQMSAQSCGRKSLRVT